MKRALLVLLVVVLAGCAAPTAPQPPKCVPYTGGRIVLRAGEAICIVVTVP